MRILDEVNDKKIDAISLFLTKEETLQMAGYLEEMLANPDCHHVHLSSDDYQKEVTLCMYDQKKLDDFHPRAKRLILEDE